MERVCKCGTTFTPPDPRSQRKLCYECSPFVHRARRSDAGQRRTQWVVKTCECGKQFEVEPSQAARARFCSQRCVGVYAHGGGRPPRGARQVDRNGYRWVWLPADKRPVEWKHNGYPEHRQVMREKLGRDLLAGENVHHINGVKTDNRPENLELWTTQQPKGQRVEDVLAWAQEVVRRYQ